MNIAAPGFDLTVDLAEGFAEFFLPLHRRFTPEQQRLVRARAERLARAHAGDLPNYLPPSAATSTNWKIDLPAWVGDQRNQMTGPADDGELVVKMINSGAPGIMLDLEDSMVNEWEHLMLGHRNVVEALRGTLAYDDRKRGRSVGITRRDAVIWTRVRPLHLSQAGIVDDELASASVFDVALLAFSLELDELPHGLLLYIPKSESAEEAIFWRDLFAAVSTARGWPGNAISCMALVEAHSLAYEVEEFLYNLRDSILGLNLGRWDYMASLIHFNLNDPHWLLPDRNTIPHDVAFFQNLRTLLPQICHRRGVLAIGGMTALYPSREDAELNARALDALERDKRNEASCGMDGAWTGHPDQNAIAVAQFPEPNQLAFVTPDADLHPDLRPAPLGIGATTIEGTRAAIRTVIRYRKGVLDGRGASLIDGYMEDLATDRIYRLMIAQRLRFPGEYTPRSLADAFDEELDAILASLPPQSSREGIARFRRARLLAEQMILTGAFDPR
ncbi:MAG: hypothetical protein HKL91_05255 [Candidatus Eremiobacteraeota bacterium]|uniref:malate synthase n=1 Tax=mine drainage metagenome TaxID=410659 RepID=E6PEL2_9ZZZZ|nr:hypothetical protein [Candidatus Eremiobacteraeota bacterium]